MRKTTCCNFKELVTTWWSQQLCMMNISTYNKHWFWTIFWNELEQSISLLNRPVLHCQQPVMSKHLNSRDNYIQIILGLFQNAFEPLPLLLWQHLVPCVVISQIGHDNPDFGAAGDNLVVFFYSLGFVLSSEFKSLRIRWLIHVFKKPNLLLMFNRIITLAIIDSKIIVVPYSKDLCVIVLSQSSVVFVVVCLIHFDLDYFRWKNVKATC